jgi:hypothetical protein
MAVIIEVKPVMADAIIVFGIFELSVDMAKL